MFLTMPACRYLLFLSLFLYLHNSALANDISAPKKEVKIGVLAFQGNQRTLARWQPTINYLNTQFKNHSFRLVTLQLHQVGQTIADKQLDFIITNTGNYITMEHRYGISRMATLINKHLNHSTTVFGAVIFTRADRDDINSINDIRNKSLIAVNENGFGGFQMTWAELKKNNVDPYSDLKELKFTGFPQSQVLKAVLYKEYDVGTFRTDSLEQLEKIGAINLSDIKIINPQYTADFPYLHSTALYPEWPLSKLHHTSKELAQRVTAALLSIENNTTKNNSAGWTIPLDYKPVNDLMKDLHVGPYKNLERLSLSSIIKNYWQLISFIFILFIIVIISALFFIRLNSKLNKANSSLEEIIVESSRLTEELTHKATHDSLTNVYNRYAFNSFLEKELQLCKRNKTLLAVIIIDLDNFKEINDNYGHYAGDDFLKQFCARIDKVLRDSDINARLGGDEFAILCRDINGCVDLEFLTKRILTITNQHYNLIDVDEPVRNTSFSLGIAIYPNNGNDAEALLRYADSEMYKMKKL